MTLDRFDPFTEDIPAYVLGALSRAEAAALKSHLETCEACRSELARYQQIGDGLLAIIQPLQPAPASVQKKLMVRVGAKTSPARFRFKWSFRRIAFGLLTLVLLGANAAALLQIRDLRREQARLTGQVEESRSILGLLVADTETHPISGEGFSGNLLLDRERNVSYLLMWNLPLPPSDSVYQIWLVAPGGERIDAGSFRPEGEQPFTSAALVTSRSFTEFVGVEVTIEPTGGSDSPTGEQVLSVGY